MGRLASSIFSVTKSEEHARRMIAKGPLRFILLRGMLAWGVPMGVLFALLIHYGFSGCCADIRNDYVIAVVMPLAIFLAGGVIWGSLTYYVTLLWLRWRDRRGTRSS